MKIPPKKTIEELKAIKNQYNENDWSLDFSWNVESLLYWLETLEDIDERKEFVKEACDAFYRKYGLSTDRNDIKVLMIAWDQHWCWFVRSQKPAKYLNREPWFCAFPTIKLATEFSGWADIVVWQRQYKQELVAFRDNLKQFWKIVLNHISKYDDY